MNRRFRICLAGILLFCCFGTRAVAETYSPEHQWIIKLGERSYGLAGVDGRPGRAPHSYLLFAGSIFEVPLPFYATVAGVSLPVIVTAVLLLRLVFRRPEPVVPLLRRWNFPESHLEDHSTA